MYSRFSAFKTFFLSWSMAIFVAGMFLTSCTKETKEFNRQDTYLIDDVTVKQPGGDKNHTKTTTEFISIAYTDLFNASVPNDTLTGIQQVYEAFGDKKLIEDMIIRHFLSSSAIKIPTSTAMRADIPKFVDQTIQKLFNRTPDAFEKYFITDIIQKDNTITSALVYYAVMTSDEYRYY